MRCWSRPRSIERAFRRTPAGVGNGISADQFHFRPFAGGTDAINFISESLEGANLVMADHQHLEAEGAARIMDDFDQARHEGWVKPAILFIEDEETAVGVLIERRQRKQPEADRQDIGDRSPLPIHHILFLPLPVDVELDCGGSTVEAALDLEGDRLLEHFLECLRELPLDDRNEIAKKLPRERIQRFLNGVGDRQVVGQFLAARLCFSLKLDELLTPRGEPLEFAASGLRRSNGQAQVDSLGWMITDRLSGLASHAARSLRGPAAIAIAGKAAGYRSIHGGRPLSPGSDRR